MRYLKLDCLRGITVSAMIVYHVLWNLVYLFDVPIPWYESRLAYIWQQSICWCFILLSGFCWSLGKKKVKRGLLVFLAGAVVTGVTVVVMPDSQVIFGVLTLLGSSMLLLIPLEKLLRKVPAFPGLLLMAGLFLLTRNVGSGYLGFEAWNLWKVPAGWYQNLLTAYLGFPMRGFYSTDYFSLIPWFFLYVTGYFLYRLAKEKKVLPLLEKSLNRQLEKIGKHSLLIYMLHQPLAYLVLSIVL